ncbi:MAG: hypothetical protein PHG08_05360 [Bacilli bacterium]|nr:hypothetical protein [Bacilli bacterium]
MELKINCNAFVKLHNLLGVTSIESTVSDYQYHGDTLEGKLLIKGTYLDSEGLIDKQWEFKEEVPFMVIFKDDQNEIEDVGCDNFNYYEVAGRGIETSFDVIVNYHEKTRETNDIIEVPSETDDLKADYEELTVNENTENLETEERLLEELINDQANKPEKPEESTENQAINEEIKERITSKMDIILSEKIKSKTDNFPSEDEKEEVTRSFKSPKDTIKILYYQDERMLDVLCSKYDLSIEEVLKQKQARDGKRMILGID